LSEPRPGRFNPGKDPLPIVQEAGWGPRPIWTGAENLARSGSLYRMSYRGPSNETYTLSNSFYVRVTVLHRDKFLYNKICFRAGSEFNSISILILLHSCLQTCMTYSIAKCVVNKLPMMDRGTVRKM